MVIKTNIENWLTDEFPSDRLTWQKGLPTFHPESAEEASRLIKLAIKHAQPLYLNGFGNNIDPVGEKFEHCLLVKTDRLNKLLEIAPEDFYVKAGGGYPLKELNKRLAENDLYFPHSSLPYVGSVGGAVAVGLSAELHDHDLPIKKYLISAEIVTADGEIITPGSVCFKSVSGYDIVKIFSPSWGLLGLVVSATFRVMPVSGELDFKAMKMREVNRKNFLAGLEENNTDTSAIYSRKIKNKFDPATVLPVV